MREWFTGRKAPFALAGAALVVSATAVALPWDIDMADGQARKAYSHEMSPPPDGAVAQPNALTPRHHPRNLDLNSPEAQAATNPYTLDEDLLALGGKMYNTYCWPCHGVDQSLGPVAAEGRFPKGMIMPVVGPASTVKVRSDGFLYFYIRNGGSNMPSYGWAMSDREMWATVAYLRSFSGNKYILGQ